MAKGRLECFGFWSRAALAVAAVATCVLLASPASAQTTREYQLRWRVPPEPDVASYKVFLGNASRTYGTPLNIGEPAPDGSGVAETLLTGLDASKSYYVAMTAVDGAGNESALSNEIVVAAVACTVAQCDDGNSCTVDSCGSSGCVHANVSDGTGCNDGNSSTFFDSCRAGVCVGQTPECTTNSQCPDLDSNVCTGGRVCSNYECVSTPALTCPSPSNPCQAASCNALTGCTTTNVPNGTTCNDGNAGTLNDVCTNGSCSGTAAECTSNAGCADLDANVCTGVRVCSNYKCVSTAPLTCPSPSNPCQAAACDPVSGCTTANVPNGTTCNDGNAGTLNDVCTNGSCAGTAAECTSNAGCADLDGNVCTGVRVCSNYKCVSTPALSCPSPSNACQAASCDPIAGCTTTNVPNGTSCDDGDAATQNDVCASGVCAGEIPPAPTPVGCEDVFGAPTARRLALTDRPDTTMTVVWDAPLNPAGAEVRYQRAGTNQWFSLRGEARRQDGCEATFAATLSGLIPGATYEYAVSGAGENGPLWTNTATFGTAPRTGTDAVLRVMFVAGVGSVGAAGSDAAAAVRDRVAKHRPNFLLGGGGYAYAADAVGAGLATSADDAVENWFEQMTPAFAVTPFVPAYGDGETEAYWHEETREMYASRQPTFAPGGPGSSYSFDASNAHFLAIDAPTAAALLPTTAEGAAHLDWIAQDLAAARQRGVRWIVVFEHLDLWSSEAGAPAVESVRNALATLFERYRVSLVLTGDGTSTERTWPLANGAPVQTKGNFYSKGVVYLRAGAGGRTAFGAWAQSTRPTWSAVRDNQRTELILLNFMNARSLQVNSISVDPVSGSTKTVDTFYIK